ncbi:MAG: DMT family transporter [Deferribacteraceae bacterium]|jgi:drug/metabolite transporter (DMT)-like permease|nr:DMT family transporter [Deferribacteraceae bacterium]
MNKFMPVLALLMLTLVWSYNWTVMKSVLPYIGAFEFAALRAIFGACILFLVLIATHRPLTPPPLLPTIVVGVLQTAGMTSLGQLALITGGVGTTAVLTYSMPFWVIIFAAIFLKERMSGLQKIAFAIAAAGFVCILRPWEDNIPLLSFILALSSGIAWACGSVTFKRLYARQKIDLLGFTTWQMLFGALLLIVLAFATHSRPIIWSGVAGALAYNAFLATALAWVLWLFILKSLPTSIAGLSSLLVPVTSIFFAWICINEVPDLYEALGIALIVFALLLISLPGLLHVIKKKACTNHA